MEPRNQGYAKAIMGSRPGYLRNLTEEGCKIVTVSALPHGIGEVITLRTDLILFMVFLLTIMLLRMTKIIISNL